jgi:hypothetical protein
VTDVRSAAAEAATATPAGAQAVWRFDVVWFATTPPPIHFGQAQFDALNEQAGSGHYLVMPTAQHLDEIRTNGNFLAAYVNDFNGEKSAAAEDASSAGAPKFWGRTAAARAAEIEQWFTDTFPNSGEDGAPRPGWIFLNEISRGAWTNEEQYPSWVADLAAHLEQAGFSVVVFSPFTLPSHGGNLAERQEAWSSVAAHAYIAVESYLPGSAIVAAADTPEGRQEWCETRYTEMLASYQAIGVTPGKLFLCEHFGQTLASVGRGRTGVSPDDWLSAIDARSLAAKDLANAGRFSGYATYAWGYNQMGADEQSLVRFEEAYTAHALPRESAAIAAV